MWNFGFIIPSFFIIIIILMFYFSLPRLDIRKNHFFLLLLIVELAVISLDIFSSYADNNYRDLPLFLTYLLNIGYFVAFYARGACFFVFIASSFRLLNVKNIHRYLFIHIPLLICEVLALTTPWTGLIFSITDEGYVSGPLYNILYVLFGYYLFLSFLIVFLFAKKIRRKRHYYSLFFCNTTLLVGIILRKLFPTLLLMDTFCLINSHSISGNGKSRVLS